MSLWPAVGREVSLSLASPGDPAQETPPLPSFSGRTLDGKPLSLESFPGQRLVVFWFNPGVEQAKAYAKALVRLSAERSRHNFAIVGVAMGLDASKSRDFVKAQKLDFPVFDDSDGEIASALKLQTPLMLVGADPDRKVGLAMVAQERGEEQPAESIEARLREYLRLPPAGERVDGSLEQQQPKAPLFEAARMDKSGSFRLADHAGKPVIVMFFLSSCPHCQDALRFFRDELKRQPEATRPVFAGISTDTRSYSVMTTLEEKQLDFFPVLVDPDKKVIEAYGSFAGVPDILLVNAEGRIVYREMGWNQMHDPDVMRMQLAKLVGRQVPMLLSRAGYSGNDACAVCHPSQAATWGFTSHAFAFETLVKRAADKDEKCVGCHVVGFGEKGGYTIAGHEEHFEDVGCENCHGRGGGHLDAAGNAGDAKQPADYRAACAKCHDPEHSLGFHYETFLPKVSHAAIGALAPEVRARLVVDRDKPREVLPKTSAYIGSAACQSCHQKEFEIWSGSAHAHAIESLARQKKDGDEKCVVCHVTAQGRPGGFPAGAKPAEHSDLARVGCESCHGPGAEHVKAGGKQPAGIVRLTDKCDSCVILQICGSCHDDQNDPRFRFEVESKIAKQKHGPHPLKAERSR